MRPFSPGEQFSGEKLHLRVLVVDDELLIRWSIAEVLKQRGHAVVQAADARTALHELTSPEEKPDIALLDLRLPDSEDFGLLQSVRRMAPDTSIVLMTAYGTPEITAEALRLGARAVMDKPFDMAAVEPVLLEAYTSRPAQPPAVPES